MTVYMAITADKYELPIAVFETIEELAAYMHVSTGKAEQSVLKNHKYYRKVTWDDDKDLFAVNARVLYWREYRKKNKERINAAQKARNAGKRKTMAAGSLE